MKREKKQCSRKRLKKNKLKFKKASQVVFLPIYIIKGPGIKKKKKERENKIKKKECNKKKRQRGGKKTSEK